MFYVDPAVRILTSLGIFILLLQQLSPGADEKVISQQEEDYARNNLAAENLALGKQLKIKAKELKVRGGLPNFYAKVRAGKPVKIAYFGGSITAHNGWRPQTFSALQERFPQSRMKMIQAAVGGTGSIVGVFRADHELISTDPDLVFIEFAVNDGSSAVRRKGEVVRALEGIIRKVKLHNPETDICLFYTMQTHNVETIREGYCQPAVAVHEQVAGHYQLPSIYVGPSVVAAIDRGEAVFKGKVVDRNTGVDADGKLVIAQDGTHPVIPTGHQFYADTVMRGMDELAKASSNSPAPALPAPIYGDSWELAKTIPAHENATFVGSWEKLTAENGPKGFRYGKRIYSMFPFLYRTDEPGASFSVTFEGSVIGIKGMKGPDSGIITIEVDGDVPKTSNLFSVYNVRNFYSGGISEQLLPGRHTVKWTLSDEKPDKEKILRSYHREGNEKDLLENPEKYSPNRFSVGEILLIGEVVE